MPPMAVHVIKSVVVLFWKPQSRFIGGLRFRTMIHCVSALSFRFCESVARHKGASRDDIIATL